LDFVKDPCYQDKRELRHSPYQYAIRKLPFLRILRKSYVGKADAKDVKEWQNQVKEIFKTAEIK
jgi:histone H3/H4